MIADAIVETIRGVVHPLIDRIRALEQRLGAVDGQKTEPASTDDLATRLRASLQNTAQ